MSAYLPTTTTARQEQEQVLVKPGDEKLEPTPILRQNQALFTNHLITANEPGGSTVDQIKLGNRWRVIIFKKKFFFDMIP